MLHARAKVVSLIGILVALPVLGIYFLFFHMYTTFLSSAVSPDGVYSCQVIEKANGSHCEAFVTIRSRLIATGRTGKWKIDFEDRIDNDSVSRQAYSIAWRPTVAGSAPAVEVTLDVPLSSGRIVDDSARSSGRSGGQVLPGA